MKISVNISELIDARQERRGMEFCDICFLVVHPRIKVVVKVATPDLIESTCFDSADALRSFAKNFSDLTAGAQISVFETKAINQHFPLVV